MNKQKKSTKNNINDVVLTFSNLPLDVIVDSDVYSEKKSKKIKQIIKILSREICIDKSYVAYRSSKYQKTFIKEAGWNELCNLLIKTDLGNKSNTILDSIFLESYNLIICCYVYQFLEDLGYSSEGICILLDVSKKYDVKVQIDNIQEWKQYKGKWQTWK